MTNYYGHYIAAPTGTGTITNKYALVTEANAGNVGIGTTAPATTLSVVGTTRLSGTTDIYNGSELRIWQSGNSSYGAAQFRTTGTAGIGLDSAGVEVIRLTTQGNVGIGTTAPVSALDVRGNVAIGGAANNYNLNLFGSIFAYMSMQTTSSGITSSDGFQIGFENAGVYFVNRENTPMIFSTNNGEKVRIDNQGKVGISNTSPGYLLHVGSSATTTGTTVARFENAGGTCDVVPSTTGGITCTSDMRLKKNITTLGGDSWSLSDTTIPDDASTLDKILALTPVQFNMLAETDSSPLHTGFIAQEVQDIFPDLVRADNQGNLSLNYTGLTPYIIQAIQDMHLEIHNITNMNKPNTFRDALVSWFGDVGNGIEKFFAKEVQTDKLCVDDVCVTRDQFKAMVEQSGITQPPVSTPTTPPVTPPPTDTPPVITPPTDTPPSTPPTDTPPVVTPPTDTPPVTLSPPPSTPPPVVIPPTITPPQDQSVPPVDTRTPDTTSSPQVASTPAVPKASDSTPTP